MDPLARLLASPSGRDVAVRVLALLREGGDVGDMLRETLQLMARAAGAERGLLFLLREGEPLRATLNLPDRAVTLEGDDYSTTLVRRVLTTGRPVLVSDVDEDVETGALESVRALGMTSILAAPIELDGRVLGAVYLDARRRGKRFTKDDLDRIAAFAALVARPVHQAAELRRRGEEIRRLEEVVRSNAAALESRARFQELVGRSDPMRGVYATLERLAGAPYPVLVTGETGTGKELAARALHFAGPRRPAPFLPVNAAGLPASLLESQLFGHVRGAFTGADQPAAGLFRAAHGGTLFLDEVQELAPALQSKLLRVLEEGKVLPVGGTAPVAVDVRLVAATNRDPQELLENGELRRDLYYRLSVFTIRMPALRERAEDVPLLADHFLAALAKETGKSVRIAPEAVRRLARYPWPGNVRELRNELRRLSVLVDGTIRAEDLPERIRDAADAGGRGSLRDRLAQIDRRAVQEALERHGWNLSHAARDLGLARNTLKTRIRRHGLKRPK